MIRTLEKVARAKLNLTLRVVGKRADGMHLLDGLAGFTDFGDRVRISTGQERDSLRVIGPFEDRVQGENIALTALNRFRNATPVPDGVAIEIEKNIPVAAGLGGGSCDAAAVLNLLQEIAAAPLDPAALLDLAVSLGADVPVCLGSKSALMRGIGEVLLPVGALPALPILLVNPGVELTAGQIFRNFRGPYSSPAPIQTDEFNTESGLLTWMGPRAHNDLIAPAARAAPVVLEVLTRLSQSGGIRSVGMSGSGSTCFAMFGGPDAEYHIRSTEEAARRRGWWTVGTTLLP